MLEITLIQKIAIWLLPVLFAITVHEVAHGWVASQFGDQTARFAGRLTLNPAKHIDIVGTIVVPIILLLMSNFIFGWAKPVPVDARNLRNPKRDMVIVSAAGPISNLLMALAWGGIAKIGFLLYVSNTWLSVPLIYMGQAGIIVNVVLGVLNCLPIPPLDGGQVLYHLLPRGKLAWYFHRLEPYGFFILILLMITGVLSYVMTPMVFAISNGISLLFALG